MKKTYKVAPNIAWRRVEEDVVVLNLDSSSYYSFNDVGAAIWTRLAENAPFEEAVDAVAEGYDADRKTIEKDANQFLKEILAEKFLEPA